MRNLCGASATALPVCTLLRLSEQRFLARATCDRQCQILRAADPLNPGNLRLKAMFAVFEMNERKQHCDL